MRLTRPVTLLLLLLSGALAHAAPLPPPQGAVILTVTGKIDNTTRDGAADFDLAALEALPQHTFDTTTPWTEGSHRYQGVRLSTLLEYLKAQGQHLTAEALNDYRINIELETIRDYPVILATHRDGEPMRIRDKGPLWILYPMADYPELDQPSHHAAMVWQLRRLTVE